MLNTDIKLYLTGAGYDGALQANPERSLGGYRSSFEVSSTAMRNIFDHVLSTQSADGHTEYRCICIKNNHATDTLSSAKVWISSNTTSADTEVEIAVEQPLSQPTGQSQELLISTEEPKGLDFYDTCIDYSTGLSLGDLEAGQICYVWIKRTNIAGSQAAYDSFTLGIQGTWGSTTAVQFRERRSSNTVAPLTSFAQQGASEFRMSSPATVVGQGYLLLPFKRSDLENKTLRITWDGSFTSDVAVAGRTYAYARVYDGTLDASVDSDWPNVDEAFKGNGVICEAASKSTDGSNPSTFSETNQDYTLVLGEGEYDTCTLAIVLDDKWIGSATTIDIDKITILDGSTTIFTYDFPNTDAVTMSRAGTYSDYGYINMVTTPNTSQICSYCITDIKPADTRLVMDNGLVKIKSRIEGDRDSGSIDFWIKDQIWDSTKTSQEWLYIGRIKPMSTSFDAECPWSRIFINYHDYNKTIIRFWFTSSIYMDMTLFRGSQGVKMQWSSGITGYTYLEFAPAYRARFGYGEGADPVDALIVSSDGWNSLGITNNWCIAFDDDQDYYIGLTLTDNAVAPRCYVNTTGNNITKLSLGTGSNLFNPHFIFFTRRIANCLYTYDIADLYGGAQIATDADASLGYAIRNLQGSGSDTHTADDVGVYLYAGATIRAGTRTTYSANTTITRLGFKMSKVLLPVGNITFTIRRVADDSVLASVVWGDASALTGTPTWYEADIGPVTVAEAVRISVEYNGGDVNNNVYVRYDFTGSKASHNYCSYIAAWVDGAADMCFKIYYDLAYASWSVQNLCDIGNYRLIIRQDSGAGYSYSDTSGTNSAGRNYEYYDDIDYYYDYLLYIPKTYEDNTGVSGPDDIANELLCDWDYGIGITDDNNKYYELYPTYATLSNDWNISPTSIICLPESLDILSSGSISFYRALFRDFANAARYDVEDSTNTPGAWYDDMPSDGSTNMTVTLTRIGQYKIIGNRTLYRLGFKLSKTNNPTGNIYFRVRDASTDSILASVTFGDAATLTGVQTWYELDLATPVTINGAVYISVEMDVSPPNPHQVNVGCWNANPRDAEYYGYYDGSWHTTTVRENSYKLYFNDSATGTEWGIDDKGKIDADGAYCWIANDITPETIAWDIDVPDGYTWAFVRLHAQADGTMGYQIRSDDVSTTYYTLEEDYYDVEDAGEQYPIDQYWAYFEGYIRVSPGATNTIRLNSTGASGDKRNVVDYIDFVPVKIAPFMTSQAEGTTITVQPISTKRMVQNRWRNHYLSRSVKGRMNLKNMYVSSGIDMNQNLLIAPVAENRADFPITGDVFTFTFPFTFGEYEGVAGQIMFKTSDNKFYGYTGDEWVEL